MQTKSRAHKLGLRGSLCFLICALIAGSVPALEAQADKTWKADNGNGTYTNPLFFDEFSDPDMIRVGKDFYLTGTTMHAMPGLPILHSRDLVNWEFVGYALDRLDLGPGFRLEEGKSIYGQGIWAPTFRYHNGTFYIFSNVNGQTTQLFRATNPAGPWTRTPMKQSFHDLSVLFDDDGKAYIVWGYRSIHLAQLNNELTDIVPGSEHEIISPSQGMGEGLHLYKFQKKYFLTSAWYLGEMRMPVGRADNLNGPWEVNQEISRGEDFGFAEGNRLNQDKLRAKPSALEIVSPSPSAVGRLAIHQGGIVDTPTGEWWGFSMMDANSVGRLTNISPITWKDGWPYFGLPGNLGRTPRTWVKPNTGATDTAKAPYQRSDDFSATKLQPIWQWNHIPVSNKWSLTERPGFLRLHALAAESFLHARNTLTQRAIGPRSTPTVVLEAARLQAGDIAGFALLNRPYAGLGVEKTDSGLVLTRFEEQGTQPIRVPVTATRLWLRAECDYLKEEAQFSYSTDGQTFQTIGSPFRLVFQLLTFQGVRYSLFSYNQAGKEGGYADFDSIDVYEPNPHGITRPIPYGKQIKIAFTDSPSEAWLSAAGLTVKAGAKGTAFTVVNRNLGRVALQTPQGFLSVASDGSLSIKKVKASEAQSFQWSETFTGELTLMSLTTHRYLRANAQGALKADSPGVEAGVKRGGRLHWTFASASEK